MVDKEQNNTPSPEDIIEKEYSEISQKADDLFDLGKEEEGIRELKKGLELAQSRGNKAYELFFQSELAHYEQKDDQEALRLKQQAADLKNDSVLILRNVAINLYHLGREEEALEWFDRALSINPKDYDSLRQKGVSLSKLGREEEAFEWFDRALEIKPDDFDTLRFRAYILNKLGRTQEAKRDLDKTLEIKPQEREKLLLDQINAEEEQKKAELEAHDMIGIFGWMRGGAFQPVLRIVSETSCLHPAAR